MKNKRYIAIAAAVLVVILCCVLFFGKTDVKGTWKNVLSTKKNAAVLTLASGGSGTLQSGEDTEEVSWAQDKETVTVTYGDEELVLAVVEKEGYLELSNDKYAFVPEDKFEEVYGEAAYAVRRIVAKGTDNVITANGNWYWYGKGAYEACDIKVGEVEEADGSLVFKMRVQNEYGGSDVAINEEATVFYYDKGESFVADSFAVVNTKGEALKDKTTIGAGETVVLQWTIPAPAVTDSGEIWHLADGDKTALKINFGGSAAYVNPLTGETSEEKLPARPLNVSIDNVGDAVPQSWISKADMVFEFPVEGEQTRLQAIYYGEFPDEFGPIRSTRPYFVDLAREYQSIFLAHGWSPQAKTYLLSDVCPYINAMNSDCRFYRVSDKTAPHNSYIKWSEVKDKIDETGWWEEQQKIRSFRFIEEGAKAKGSKASYVQMRYGSASCEFTYDAETKLYTRTIDGSAYVDHETGEAIKVSNVIVQDVYSSVLDAKGRLSIDYAAGGDAVLYSGGKKINGTWEKDNLDTRAVFKDENGNEFILQPGSTWVIVADQNCAITDKK